MILNTKITLRFGKSDTEKNSWQSNLTNLGSKKIWNLISRKKFIEVIKLSLLYLFNLPSKNRKSWNLCSCFWFFFVLWKYVCFDNSSSFNALSVFSSPSDSENISQQKFQHFEGKCLDQCPRSLLRPGSASGAGNPSANKHLLYGAPHVFVTYFLPSKRNFSIFSSRSLK